MNRFLACLAMAASLEAQPAADRLKQGEDVFNKTCATGYCHAPKGGPGGGAPRLAARGFDEAYINATTTRGLPGTPMPAFSTVLNRGELSAVIAYVASLNGIAAAAGPAFGGAPGGGRGGPPQAMLPPEAIAGRELFTDSVRGFARCATCHEAGGVGISVASPISTIPADAAALRALATPHVQTVTVEGDSMPALMLSQGKQRTVFYDLTTVPPVRRTSEAAGIKVVDGSGWKHSAVIASYSDTELNSILQFLKAVVK